MITIEELIVFLRERREFLTDKKKRLETDQANIDKKVKNYQAQLDRLSRQITLIDGELDCLRIIAKKIREQP